MKAIVLLSLLFTLPALAGPWERTSDQRTILPEDVIKGRKEWGTDFTLGYSQYTGNVSQIGANADISLFKKLNKTSVYWNGTMVYGLSGRRVTQNQGKMTFRLDYPQTENFKWFVFNTHAYNRFLKLDYRTSLGAGPWYDFIGKNWKNGISLAPTFFYEEFDGFSNERSLFLSLRNYLVWNVSEFSVLGLDTFYLFRCNYFADHQIFFQPFFQTQIKPNKLSLKLMYSLERDSKPKPGVKNTDLQYFSSLVFHFGE